MVSQASQSLERFEELLARCDKLRTAGLPFDELQQLARLYREQSARLARLRDRDGDPDAIRYLNALCVRAYGFLYSGPVERKGWVAELPVALARTWRPQLLAWTLLALGVAIGASLASRDPSALYALLPAGFGYTPDRIDRLWSSADERGEFLAREEAEVAENALFGSALFTHNTRVGILSFATGILAGIPTALLQLYNGLVVGAFSALFLREPWAIEFLAWVLPHAVPELTAVTLCCAAGLLLGGAVAAPGRRSRSEALREAAGSALLLFAASLPLFLVAASVESFVRESALGTSPRLVLAAIFALVLLLSLLAVYRLDRRLHPVETRWLLEIPRPT